jgi:hypothetical protein
MLAIERRAVELFVRDVELAADQADAAKSSALMR